MPTISIKIANVKKQAVIVASFPFRVNWSLLNTLVNNCNPTVDESETPPHAHATVLLFSLYKLLEYKTGASAIDASRAKFTTVRVDTQNGESILTFYTEPTFSAVRKILTIISKNIDPSRLTPLYRKYASVVGVKPEPAHFTHAANEMVTAIKTLAVFVTGTLRVPDGKESVLRDIVNSIKPDKITGASRAESGKQEKPDSSECIKCGSALESFLVQQLLQSNQVESVIRDGHIMPVTGSSAWATVSKKFDADRIKKFVELKLVKLNDRLPHVILFMAASTGYFTAKQLADLPDKYTEAMLVSHIKKHF